MARIARVVLLGVIVASSAVAPAQTGRFNQPARTDVRRSRNAAISELYVSSISRWKKSRDKQAPQRQRHRILAAIQKAN
jgi:hypothetical protein